VIALGLLIMVIDFLIMAVIKEPLIYMNVPDTYGDLIEVILLTLVISPLLYSLVFKKLKSEALLQQINATVQEAIVIVNEHGRIAEWNPAAQRKFQYNQAEAIGQPLYQLLAPSHYHADAARGFAEFQKTGKGPLIGLINEVTAIRKDGSEFPIELSVSAFKVRAGWYAVGVMRDISERKRIETALREREAEFHTLAEAMPQIVWITRTDGWNIYFNRQWMDYTGLTLEEGRGHGWNKPFHPDDQQRAWDAWQLAVTGRGTYSIESRLRRADGIYRWWLVRGVPVKDSNGDILKWFGTCTDIHDLKMAELVISNTNAELRESERRFSDMLGNIELISMMLDHEARITYCNEYLLHLTGWKREEIIGRNWFDIFIPPELNDLKDSFFERVLADLSEAHHHENEILTRSGERLLIHWNNSVLRSVDGDVIGTASIGEDITQYKQTQDALRASREELHRLLNSIAEGAYGVDTDGNCTFVNHAFMRMLGYQNDVEVMGKHIHELIHYSYADGRPYPANECKANGASRLNQSINVSDEVFWRRDGVAIPVEYWSHPIVSDGVALGSIVTFIDITERKKVESNLAEQLAELRRWHDVTSGREGRVLELKHEVNELLEQTGKHPRYPSAEAQNRLKE